MSAAASGPTGNREGAPTWVVPVTLLPGAAARLLRQIFRVNRTSPLPPTGTMSGLIISLIFLVILTALTAFGDTSTGIFNGAMNAIRNAMGG